MIDSNFQFIFSDNGITVYLQLKSLNVYLVLIFQKPTVLLFIKRFLFSMLLILTVLIIF